MVTALGEVGLGEGGRPQGAPYHCQAACGHASRLRPRYCSAEGGCCLIEFNELRVQHARLFRTCCVTWEISQSWSLKSASFVFSFRSYSVTQCALEWTFISFIYHESLPLLCLFLEGYDFGQDPPFVMLLCNDQLKEIQLQQSLLISCDI